MVAEWNPSDPHAGHGVGFTLSMLGIEDPGSGWVERVDVCADAERDPFMVLLDYPRCRKSSHGYGLTSRGYETVVVGYAKGEKRKMRRYDKRAERAASDVVVSSHWCRVELEAWAPFAAERPAERSDGGNGRDAEGGDVRLRDLASIACPIRPGGGVVELVREPSEYGDQRFLALGCVAMQTGPKAARACARELVGGNGVKRAEFVLWDDVTGELLGAFDHQWASVVRGVLGQLSPS